MIWRVYRQFDAGHEFYFDLTDGIDDRKNPDTNDPGYMLRLHGRTREWRALYWDGFSMNDANERTDEFLAVLSEEQKAQAITWAIDFNRGN